MLCVQLYGVHNCYSIILCGQQYVVDNCVTVLRCIGSCMVFITELHLHAVWTAVWC